MKSRYPDHARAAFPVTASTPDKAIAKLRDLDAALGRAMRTTHVMHALDLALAIQAAAHAEWHRRVCLAAGHKAAAKRYAEKRAKQEARAKDLTLAALSCFLDRLDAVRLTAEVLSCNRSLPSQHLGCTARPVLGT